MKSCSNILTVELDKTIPKSMPDFIYIYYDGLWWFELKRAGDIAFILHNTVLWRSVTPSTTQSIYGLFFIHTGVSWLLEPGLLTVPKGAAPWSCHWRVGDTAVFGLWLNSTCTASRGSVSPALRSYPSKLGWGWATGWMGTEPGELTWAGQRDALYDLMPCPAITNWLALSPKCPSHSDCFWQVVSDCLWLVSLPLCFIS